MSDRTDNLLSLIKPYGLSDEESRIYLFLLEHGSATALTISRKLKMGRTKVYRLIDRLHEKQLIAIQVKERGMSFVANHPNKFLQLITEKKAKLEALENSLPNLVAHLQSLTSSANKESEVLVYHGIEGLKQVSWNALRAKDYLRVYEMEHISDFLPNDFSEKFRQELVNRRITTKDLTNKTHFDGYTQVEEIIEKYSQVKHLDPSLIKIQFEVLIYNDVYATYTYKEKEIFCVEVHNQQLAQMQKQLFDFIWTKAKPMRYLDDSGKCELVQ
jgi:sugar-specific transcriptional regulator TrmB